MGSTNWVLGLVTALVWAGVLAMAGRYMTGLVPSPQMRKVVWGILVVFGALVPLIASGDQLFFCFVVTVWGLVHVYLGNHLIGTFIRKERWRWAGWLLVAGHGVLGPVVMAVRRGAPQGLWYYVLNFVAYVGMGFVAVLFVVFAVRDLTAWATRRWVSARVNEERRVMLTGAFNVGAFLATGAATGRGLYNAIRVPEVKEVEVPVEGLADDLDGLKVALISDLHIGPILRGEWLSEVVSVVNGLSPDLVTVTGDLVDAMVEDMGEEVKPLGGLRGRYGVYYVTGNHEYYWDGPGWADFVSGLGIRALLNEHELVEIGGAKLLVGGVTDYATGSRVSGHTTDPHKAISGAPAHDFSLLLAHQPGSVYEAAKAGWRMQVSGHTHGGQFFPWNFVVGMVHEFSAGLGRHLDTLIYVSRGTGFWGPPNRSMAPSEITLLTLKKV